MYVTVSASNKTTSRALSELRGIAPSNRTLPPHGVLATACLCSHLLRLGIYVEIRIRAPLDELWAHTQEPALHERWDLRFSDITYLPRASALEPQRFRYATRIGLGIEIAGDGESVGERNLADGSRTSSLSFGSPSRL
jgi:hypothetical protein